MKNFIAVVLAALMSVYSVPVLGTENELLEKGMFFSTIDACQQAYESGEFRFYQPDPENLRRAPGMAKGLPRAGCALEDVRENKGNSPAWVILSPNVPVIFNNEGNPIMDGRCHNKIHEFMWLPLLRGLPGRDGIKGDMGPRGPKGDPGVSPKKEPSKCKTGCKVLIGIGVAAVGYGVSQLIKKDDDKKKPGPVVHTDPPTFKAGLAPSVKIGYVPSPHAGGKGGISVTAGGRLSF